jgi:hypothetical protein
VRSRIDHSAFAAFLTLRFAEGAGRYPNTRPNVNAFHLVSKQRPPQTSRVSDLHGSILHRIGGGCLPVYDVRHDRQSQNSIIADQLPLKEERP